MDRMCGLNRHTMHEMDKGTTQEMTSTRLDSNDDDVKHTYLHFDLILISMKRKRKRKRLIQYVF